MCLTEIVRFDNAAAIHLASKARGEVALLVLIAGKKYRIAVRPQLFTSKAQQVKWGYAVAREKAVQRRRPRVTRPPRVTQKQPAPAAGEDQRCAEPGRTTPDKDDVEHDRPNCKATAMSVEGGLHGRPGGVRLQLDREQ